MIEYASIVNLIKKSDKVIGLKQTLRSLEENKLDCIVMAIDSDEQFKEKIIKSNKENVKTHVLLSKSELSSICKLDVPCGVVGILKKN
ncbi:MAG: ribosomal L7Ae/L30e/S12e/Gadd45 family protein [Firmicutes bacterium]|nr:ribosomal L7Ae/L30e/S12e/Gadd45 family protein [Bacillota bacterium]